MPYGIQLKPNERIYRVVRRYGLTLVWWYILAAFLLANAFFFMFWLLNHSWWGQGLFVILCSAALVIIVRTTYLWKRTALLITSHRIIDRDQDGVFACAISEVPYADIEDVAGAVRGIIGTILRYGTLSIQTGGGSVEIVANQIRHPQKIQELIFELRKQHNAREARDFSQELTRGIIEKLRELDSADLHLIETAVRKRIAKLAEK